MFLVNLNQRRLAKIVLINCDRSSVDSSKLILNFPGSDPVKWHGRAEFCGELGGDGVSRQFKIPYLGRE